jgi:hypothetical protein
MRHRKPPRYRVLWTNPRTGALFAHDRSTMMAAIREARSLLAATDGWREIRIVDQKAGVVWTLTRTEGPADEGARPL